MIDLTKKYTCFDGCEVLGIFEQSPQHCVGLMVVYKNKDNYINTHMFHYNGQLFGNVEPSKNDLIPVPEKRTITVWVNVYKVNNTTYNTEHQAKKWADDDALLVAVKLEKEIELPNVPETQEN